MVWTYEKYLTFIEDYRKCTILWDVKNPNYTNNNKKRKIIISLANKYGLDEGSLKKKIKNLRSAFHREHHRLNKLKDEEQDMDGVRKWFGYDALKFILDVAGPKKDEQTYSTGDTYHDEPEYDQDDFDINTQYIHVPEFHEAPEPKSPETSQNNVNVSKEDEFDLFGRSMTVQLRKMPELVALDLMQKMQLMVFNAKKQLNKAKNKTKKKIAKQAVGKIGKKRMGSPSPMSHSSSPRSPSPIYKLEAISPDIDTCMWDKDGDGDFYEYQDEPSTKVTCEEHRSGTASKRQLKRNTFNSVDPLDVKISKNISQSK